MNAPQTAPHGAPLVEIAALCKSFGGRPVVSDVSFAIARGETFGLVGESGSGKTTTGRCVLRLIEPSSGRVTFDGTDLLALGGAALRRARRHFQIVFQDPYSSLNPRMRVGAIVEEPLIIHKRWHTGGHALGTPAERRDRVAHLFEMVGLSPSVASRFPHEFSGGQRQRIGLARALALEPSFLVLDEPVSALDVSVQAQVVNLLLDLQERLGLTYLFIAHDLRLVRKVCTRVAVMSQGRIVETGAAADVLDRPQHPYTQKLVASIPSIRT